MAVEVHFSGFPPARVHSSVHIAVSTSATPTDWDEFSPQHSTGSWRKSHHCLWRDDQQCTNLTAVGHNQTIYVDGDTLYIAFLDDEGTTKRTTLMMLDKDDLMNGTSTTPVFVKLGASPYNKAT